MLLKLLAVLLFNNLKHYCHLKGLPDVNHTWRTAPIIEARIIGGEPANLTKYPSNVQFFNFGGMCAGSILTSRTVLTAAHCFEFNKNVTEMTIFSNARYIFDRRAFRHDVWDYLINENYNKTVIFSNDIAIVMIKGQFAFGPSVKKAIIVDNLTWMNVAEYSFVATGWGQTEENGMMSNHGLLMTTLRYVSQKNCSTMNNITLSSDMFCLFGDGKTDTCKGDSGGGVLWNNYVVGIVSHGEGCARAPSMYVNVHLFKYWIETAIQTLHKKYCLSQKH